MTKDYDCMHCFHIRILFAKKVFICLNLYSKFQRLFNIIYKVRSITINGLKALKF